MNNIVNNPNLIKQPKECCIYCGKSYKLKANLNKHVILCEVIEQTRKKKYNNIDAETSEVNDELPSQRQMYNIIIQLTLKCNKLEEKVEKMSRFVDKKIKKINIIEWLNNNKFPEYNFDVLINKISLNQQDISIIFDKNMMEIISILLSRELFDNEIIKNNNAPIYATIQKNNYIYMYNKNSNTNINENWSELSREKLISFMNKFQNKIIKVLSEWKQQNKTQMNSSDKLCEEYNKSLLKIMSTDFKNDIIYNKIKSLFYNKLKVDMKTIIEYEFEF
jgi:hypothetical protein